MKQQITVVIPVYKVEQYLPKCVDSILVQTYPDLEIILVDDGSPDGCPALCDQYAAMDSRVHVIHQSNCGLSGARNAGIDQANGAYLMFVDSDDYIEPTMVEKLYSALMQCNADMSICGLRKVNEYGEEIPDGERAINDEVLTPQQILCEKTFQQNGWHWIISCNKLYRKELFDDLRFPLGKLHEDEYISPLLYLRCSKIACVPDELYNYVQRGDSIMSNDDDLKHLDGAEAIFKRVLLYSSTDGYHSAAAKTLIEGIAIVQKYALSSAGKLPEFKTVYCDLQHLYREAYAAVCSTGCSIDWVYRMWYFLNAASIYGAGLVLKTARFCRRTVMHTLSMIRSCK